MDEKKNEIILFENQGVKLEVNLKDETVWLNRQQLAELFDRDIKTIGKHINNSLNEELKDDNSVVAKFATTASDGKTDNKGGSRSKYFCKHDTLCEVDREYTCDLQGNF